MPSDATQIEPTRTADAQASPAGKQRLLTLDHLDGRTLAARRARELIESIETDLGGGDRITEGQRQLIQRAAVLGTCIESCEARWLAGEPVEMAEYLAAVNAQRRVLVTLGLERRARDVTPSLSEYMATRAAEKTDAGSDPEIPD